MKMRINGNPERMALIKKVLPEKPLTETILIPALKELAVDALLQTLRAEIEVYKAFPKINGKMNTETFDPRNNKTCFMGQGFFHNGSGLDDADLDDYRSSVGTLNHKVWGTATLLEVWAADHFVQSPDMVTGVFLYGKGERQTLPNLKFDIIPFFQNPESGKFKFTEEDKANFRQEYINSLNLLRTEWKMELKYELDEEQERDFERNWKLKNE